MEKEEISARHEVITQTRLSRDQRRAVCTLSGDQLAQWVQAQKTLPRALQLKLAENKRISVKNALSGHSDLDSSMHEFILENWGEKALIGFLEKARIREEDVDAFFKKTHNFASVKALTRNPHLTQNARQKIFKVAALDKEGYVEFEMLKRADLQYEELCKLADSKKLFMMQRVIASPSVNHEDIPKLAQRYGERVIAMALGYRKLSLKQQMALVEYDAPRLEQIIKNSQGTLHEKALNKLFSISDDAKIRELAKVLVLESGRQLKKEHVVRLCEVTQNEPMDRQAIIFREMIAAGRRLPAHIQEKIVKEPFPGNLKAYILSETADVGLLEAVCEKRELNPEEVHGLGENLNLPVSLQRRLSRERAFSLLRNPNLKVDELFYASFIKLALEYPQTLKPLKEEIEKLLKACRLKGRGDIFDTFFANWEGTMLDLVEAVQALDSQDLP